MSTIRILQLVTLSVLGMSIAWKTQAQKTQPVGRQISVETRITNYFSNGYEVTVLYNTRSKLSFGLQAAGVLLKNRNTKGIVFSSSDVDGINIRLPWLFALKSRYHLRSDHAGFYGEISIGAEQFRITSGSEVHKNHNGFALPSVGYIWHPWRQRGLYVNPNIGYDFIFGQPAAKTINGIDYELRSAFIVPAFSIGWKFK